MARDNGRLGIWQVLLTISMVTIPLVAHGKHTLAGVGRRHHHRNHSSSVSHEALKPHMVLSDDSAERDHLIGAGLGLGAGLPLSSSRHHRAHKRLHLDFSDEDQHLGGGGGGGEELTAGGAGPDQPGNPTSDDVITVEFHSPAPDTAPSEWPRVSEPQRQKADNPTAWTLSDFYDYLSPDDDLSALDATPVPEPSPSPPADMDDENPRLPAAAAPVVPQKAKPNAGAGRPSAPVPPLQGGAGPGKGRGQGGMGLGGGAVGIDGCRLGFVSSRPGVCMSQCDAEPDFCFNGGVCTVVAGMGAFCRCNVQEYIWNKGTRCDWSITEFQVMCVVVGGASLVLIFLFMIIVFFAKKLHHLKNENKRLRKRSKYRPQSTEPQTDGMSVSTTADGSQPNKPAVSSYTWEYKPRNPYNHHQEDPQKKEELAKSPTPKEEESMNIRNSHPSPKQENNRPISVEQEHGHTLGNTEESMEGGVTIGVELLLPKEAGLRPETSPPLEYEVFLYKLPTNGEPPPSPKHPKSPKTPRTPKSPKSPKSPKFPKSPKSPKSPKARTSPDSHETPRSPKTPKSPGSSKHFPEYPGSAGGTALGLHPSPGRHYPSGHQGSPGRHSESGCYSSPYSGPPSTSSHQASCSPPQLRRPLGQTQGPGASVGCGSGSKVESQGVHLRPSPSSPHLSQPPPSPSGGGYNAASTHSLPLLS